MVSPMTKSLKVKSLEFVGAGLLVTTQEDVVVLLEGPVEIMSWDINYTGPGITSVAVTTEPINLEDLDDEGHR